MFDLKQDEDEIIVSLTGFYGQFLDMDQLTLTANLLYAERDSDITFYDGEAVVGSLGLMYTF